MYKIYTKVTMNHHKNQTADNDFIPYFRSCPPVMFIFKNVSKNEFTVDKTHSHMCQHSHKYSKWLSKKAIC